MSVRTLMAINALIIANGEEVYEAKTKSTKDGILRVHYPLPEWCIRDDNGYLDYSENYLQFVNDKESNYILFDLEPISSLLVEEISMTGIEDLFKKIDLRPIFDKFQKYLMKDYGKYIPNTQFLVFEHTYEEYDTESGREYDSYCDLVGYLDNNMNFVEIKIKEK